MFFVFFPFFRGDRRRTSRYRGIRPQPRPTRGWSMGSLILILAIGLLIFEPRMSPLLFFLLPFLFFWFFVSFVSAMFRGLARVAVSPEEFWSRHLEDENLEIEPAEPAAPTRSMPESVSQHSRLSELWQRASELAKDPNIHRPARSALRQIHALGDLFQHFQQLLQSKLRLDELSYQRFLSSGTQGFEMITTELQEAVSRMERLRSIDASLRPTADEIAITPESYRQIQQEQLSKIDRLLSGTQEAVAQLTRVNFSIAEMRGVSPRKTGDITHAITELKDLARRAGQL